MSIATPSETSLTSVHSTFVAELPRIDRVLRFKFRHWPRDRRAEALADGRAAAWHAWSGLTRRGRDPLDVGPAGIAANAARYVRRGRRLGTGRGGPGAMDVYRACNRFGGGPWLFSLDSAPGNRPDDPGETWRDWAATDNRCTPADEACFRLDFADWLGRLPAKKRAAAELLAEGHVTGEVARRLGVTPGAVSQARAWLGASWRAFQGEDGRPDRPPSPTSGRSSAPDGI